MSLAEVRILEDAELEIAASPAVAQMYHLSPYVWRTQNGTYEMLLRVVNRSEVASEKVARIHFGTSSGGLRFSIGDDPVLAPGPSADDHDGCEDPTLIERDATYYVYYSGWNESAKEANLLYARGNSPNHLRKCGSAIRSAPQYRNPKEATVVDTARGLRLFFEYSRDDRSRIGLAAGATLDGPWTILPDPLAPSAEGWDSRMLSPGPILRHEDGYVMFYNGAHGDDVWKIGWVSFDADLQVRARGAEPIVHGSQPEPGARNMAFASSAVGVGGTTAWLYYSVADMQMRRATLSWG